MSTAHDHARSTPTRSCATALVCRKCDYRVPLSEREAYCPRCNKSLDVDYDYALAGQRLREVPMAERPLNIWHLEELLPIVDAVGAARVGEYAGYTPLIKADRLGAAVGLRNLYVKDDSTSRPSLSYKDRVVSMALARLLELGEREIGCVSTGNVGTAVASLAAKAGVPAYVFYPNRLESTKAHACRALGAKVCQLGGNYDEANKACRALAEATGLEFANITLRPFYAEGAKTVAYEIVEQLGWRAPDHIVTAAAGGTLSSRIHKGLVELELVKLAQTAHTKIDIAQPDGLLADREGDPRGRLGDPGREPDDARALARDRRARRRRVRDRRRARTARDRGDGQRQGDLRRHRPARGDRGHPHRARRRDDGGGREKARRAGPSGPRRGRRGDDHGQRLEDALRASLQAVAVEGGARPADDARCARGLPARERHRG